MLAPDPVPLFLFADARETFDEPLRTALADGGLDEAVAALRAFGLVDRETIVNERNAAITTEAIRLHRLVRGVAAQRGEERAGQMRQALMAALREVYPNDAYTNPASWPRCAALTAHLLSVCRVEMADDSAKARCADLLNLAGRYFHGGDHTDARPLFERALAIREEVLGPDHPDTATSLSNLANLLDDQGNHAAARSLCERALAIREKVLDPEHPDTAISLNNLAALIRDQGDLAGARSLLERALAIDEKALGPEHPSTAIDVSNLARVLSRIGHMDDAEALFKRAIAIGEKAHGRDHALTQRFCCHRARHLLETGRAAEALPLAEAALATHEAASGAVHPWTKDSARVTADALDALNLHDDAAALRARHDVVK
jgi:tetratricopeptide (TPR) repeat protein